MLSGTVKFFNPANGSGIVTHRAGGVERDLHFDLNGRRVASLRRGDIWLTQGKAQTTPPDIGDCIVFEVNRRKHNARVHAWAPADEYMEVFERSLKKK